jgi:hypothetical protein
MNCLVRGAVSVTGLEYDTIKMMICGVLKVGVSWRSLIVHSSAIWPCSKIEVRAIGTLFCMTALDVSSTFGALLRRFYS